MDESRLCCVVAGAHLTPSHPHHHHHHHNYQQQQQQRLLNYDDRDTLQHVDAEPRIEAGPILHVG